MSNNQLLALLFAGSMVLVTFAFFCVYFILHQRNTQNMFEAEKKRLQNELQLARVKENELIMDQAYNDIHDSIFQNAFAARMFFDLSLESEGEAKEQAIAKVHSILDDINFSATAVMHSLNHDYIKANELTSIIEDELKELQNRKTMGYEVMFKGDLSEMNTDKKVLIYRIAQDAIRVISQHGSASKIIFYIECIHNRFLMRIIDDGLIHVRDKLHTGSERAMGNIEQRCKLLNGVLSINSAPTGESSLILAIKDIS